MKPRCQPIAASASVKIAISTSTTTTASLRGRWSGGQNAAYSRAPRSSFHDLIGISPQANRRRRILTRAVPIIVVAGAAFAVGILLGAGSEIKAAERFT